MIRQFTAMTALALLAVLPAARAQDGAPCRLTRSASLDISYGRGGRAFVPVTLAGKPTTLAIDTASTYSALTEETMKTLGLARVSLPEKAYGTYGGAQLLYGAPVNGFSIAQLSVPDYTFMVLPQIARVDGAGFLGADLLSHFDADFDFGANKLNLFQPSACGDHAVYWADDYAKLPITFFDSEGGTNNVRQSGNTAITYRVARGPSVESKIVLVAGKLDGTDVKLEIGTGNVATIMNMEQAKFIFGWHDDQPGLTRLNPNQPDAQAVYSYPFKSLTLGGITVTNPLIRIRSESRISINRSRDITLGLDVLRRLHMYIAYGDKVMYVTLAEAHKTADAGAPK